jgi:hypothetical protein
VPEGPDGTESIITIVAHVMGWQRGPGRGIGQPAQEGPQGSQRESAARYFGLRVIG